MYSYETKWKMKKRKQTSFKSSKGNDLANKWLSSEKVAPAFSKQLIKQGPKFLAILHIIQYIKSYTFAAYDMKK